MRGVRPEHRRRGQRGSLGASRRLICGAGGCGLLIGLLLSVAAVVEPPRGEALPAGAAAGKVAGSAAAESPAAEWPSLALLRRHPRVAVAGGVLLALAIADQLVLRLRPRWLLRLPDQGLLLPFSWDMEAQAPKVLPLGWLLGPLKHRDRVLDAWVADHLPTVRRRFLEERPTVKQRRHHLDTLPVKVNETLVTDLTPERFRQLEGAVGGLVLISGE
ncbi:MAG: hypothetical protein VKP63_07035, partial [Cyanobacteriota bacterium]|nr:hypothetical protein [Cyanobacteriota bacterium]